jgi:hypothetical protein
VAENSSPSPVRAIAAAFNTVCQNSGAGAAKDDRECEKLSRDNVDTGEVTWRQRLRVHEFSEESLMANRLELLMGGEGYYRIVDRVYVLRSTVDPDRNRIFVKI